MSAISNYLENALLNAVFRNQPYTSTNVYVGLFTTDPTDAGTGTEVNGASYARQVVTFTAPSDGMVTNDIDIFFPISTESWGTITHIALFDAVTAGKMLFHGPLEFEKTINVSSQFKVPQNYLIIRLK